MDPTTQTELEATVLRRLLQHLDARKDVQNIELMILAGFCRNCLSKWFVEAAAERGSKWIWRPQGKGSTECPTPSGENTISPRRRPSSSGASKRCRRRSPPELRPAVAHAAAAKRQLTEPTPSTVAWNASPGWTWMIGTTLPQ